MKFCYSPDSAKPFFHSNFKNSLEGLTLETETKENTGLLRNLFADKTKSLKATVKALLDEIKLREELNIHLLKNLDEDICRLNSDLLSFKNINTYYDFDKFKDLDKTLQKIENNVLSLKNEKRKEYLECWRDIMFLKKYLMSALREYWDLVRRQEMLSSKKQDIIY